MDSKHLDIWADAYDAQQSVRLEVRPGTITWDLHNTLARKVTDSLHELLGWQAPALLDSELGQWFQDKVDALIAHAYKEGYRVHQRESLAHAKKQNDAFISQIFSGLLNKPEASTDEVTEDE